MAPDGRTTTSRLVSYGSTDDPPFVANPLTTSLSEIPVVDYAGEGVLGTGPWHLGSDTAVGTYTVTAHQGSTSGTITQDIERRTEPHIQVIGDTGTVANGDRQLLLNVAGFEPNEVVPLGIYAYASEGRDASGTVVFNMQRVLDLTPITVDGLGVALVELDVDQLGLATSPNQHPLVLIDYCVLVPDLVDHYCLLGGDVGFGGSGFNLN